MTIENGNINIDKLKEIIRCFNATNETPVRVYDSSYSLIGKTRNWADIPLESTHSEMSLKMIFNQFSHIKQKEEILLVVDNLKMSYGVVPILNNTEAIGIAIIGPVLIEQVNIESYLISMRHSNNEKKVFLEAYNNLQHITTRQLKNMCKTFMALVYSDINFFNFNFFNTSSESHDNYSTMQYTENKSVENESISLDAYQDFRYKVIKCLQTGDKEKLKSLFAQINANQRDAQSFMERKIVVRAMLNVLSFPLIGLGVNLNVITDSYVQFCAEIDKCESITKLTTIAESLVNHFLDLAKKNCNKHYSKPIKEAMNYIDQHCNEDISVATVANLVHFSPKYLSRLFKDETNITFSQYLTSKRMEKAVQLLDYTDYSLDDIALAVGYNDQSYFTKVFKKQYNITPKKYRVKK